MNVYPRKRTTISSWAAVVVKTIESYGYNPDDMLKNAGIHKKVLENPDERISADKMARLWRVAVETTKDPCFGLKAASNVRPTTFHALGFALMVSSSMHDALERLQRFSRIVSDVTEVRFEPVGDTMAVYLNPTDQSTHLADEAFDMIMAAVVSFARTLIDGEFNPVKVEMIRKKPLDPDTFGTFFQSPVVYSSAHNCICFNAQDMKKPFHSANAEIARQNDQIVVEYLARFDKSRISHLVHEKLIELLPLGEPSIEKLARAMGMTPRSLRRHLSKENAGYRGILDDIRQYLATQYLEQRHLSILEVAFRLGYSDSSNFTRAFKRWFRVSPKHYRENLH